MPDTRRVDFDGHDGNTLAARLDLPQFKPRAYALFAHCFSCSKDIHAARRIAEQLVEHGIGVLRFDFTGLGSSEGDFANTNFTTNVQDLVAAAGWMEANHGAVDLLVGHSLGGAAVVVAAGQIDSVKAVATIGAPSDADHVIQNFGSKLDQIEAEGEAEVDLGGRPFRIRKQFVEDVRGANVRDAAAELRRPLLVVHSPVDEIVGIENATGLFVSAKHPKSFLSLDQADHLMRREADAQRAGNMIAAWAEPYIFETGREQPPQEARGSRDVVVAETGGGTYENSVVIGEHFSISDEPIEVGGGGKGPDPYEYVSAGLGACTSMTLRMYASRKKWPLEHVTVAISHTKDYTDDCEHCIQEDGRKIDIFTREITIKGDLDSEQRQRLLEIADRCPVHRTLEETSLVKTHEG